MMRPGLTTARRKSSLDRLPTSGPRISLILAELLVVWAVLVAVYLYVGVDPAQFTRSTVLQLAWINNVSLVLHLLLLRKSFGSLFAPFVIYALLLSLFTSGQLILYSVGIAPAGADVLNRHAPATVARATAFYLTAFSAFCAAAVTASELHRSRRTPTAPSTIGTTAWQDGLRSVGFGCVLVGVVPFFVLNLHNLRVVIGEGYSQYYDQGARIDSALLSTGYLCITGLVFLGCCGRERLRVWVTMAIVLIAALRLASGDRGEGMIYLLTAFLLTSVFSKSPRRRFALAGAAAAFAVMVIPLIGTLRQSYGRGVSALSVSSTENPLQTTLATMGATLFPLVAVVGLADEGTAPILGLSYVAGVISVIPDALLVGPLLALMQNDISASPARWLMQEFSMSYGPGFTPFAEAYLNFGWWGGCAVFIAYGAIFALLLKLPTSTEGSDLLRIAFIIAAFALIGFSVRGSSNFIIPFLIRYVAAPGIIVALVARRREKRIGASI